MARARWERLSAQIERELSHHHQANPLQVGMRREMLRSRLGVEGKLFGGIVKAAGEAGLLVDEGAAIRLPGRSISKAPASSHRPISI